MSTILLTNVHQYVGPGACAALIAEGHEVICHDRTFDDAQARTAFEAREPRCKALRSQDPEAIYAEMIDQHSLPDAIVLNDVHPITPSPIETISQDDTVSSFEALVLTPVRLTQLFLPAMKERRCGAFVFITSARETRPEPNYAVPTTLRAATTAFAKALAKEAAPFGIQANVIAPNYLASELYYPPSRFVDDAGGCAEIKRIVPFGRLGDSSEIGALVAFFAPGRSPFTTGEVVNFTGGWP
jgi:NAD(P)-dependent dehydrogenase (short-subunit alcohol dehydrogenase family)